MFIEYSLIRLRTDIASAFLDADKNNTTNENKRNFFIKFTQFRLKIKINHRRLSVAEKPKKGQMSLFFILRGGTPAQYENFIKKAVVM